MAIPTQNWAPTSITEYILDAGELQPFPPEPIQILIKNVIDDVAPDYSEYRLQANGVTQVPWLKEESYTGKGFPVVANDFIPYTNGMSFEFTPEFEGLFELNNGYHFRAFGFTIFGKNTNNEWVGVETHSFTIRLEVVNQIIPTPVTFTPANLDFQHIKNGDPTSLSVTIDGTLWQIIGKPNITLSSSTLGVVINTIDNDGNPYQIASGNNQAVIDFELSEYYDSDDSFSIVDLASEFVVTSDGIQTGTIPFTIEITIVPDFITNPYPEAYAFTLDNRNFELYSTATDAYIQFDAVVKTYDFFYHLENMFEIPQKIILFNNKSQINLGQVIHRLMRRFENINSNHQQYKPAIVTITATEKLLADESILRTETLDPIRFIAGLSQYVDNVGFLDFNPLPNRVTKNSQVYLNILVPDSKYQIEVYKNDILEEEIPVGNPVGKIILKDYLFTGYKHGDVVTMYLKKKSDEIDETTPKKTFIVFPEGNYSNAIIWENEFLLQSQIECTGTASIKSDIEFLSQKGFNNLVEQLKHISTTKETKLAINTGWLLKTDKDTIESLMRSKRAWLVQENGTIALVPIAKSILEDDLERELIDYTLEFKINQNYNEETYSL